MSRCKKMFVVYVVCLFQIGLFAAEATATVVPKMEAEILFENTALVFEGVVLESDPYAYDEATGNPQTRVRFSVDAVYYGDFEGAELEFLLPGGFLPDGNIQTVDGIPYFHPDEIYLLFVRSGDWVLTPLTNWWHSVAKLAVIDGEYYWTNLDGYVISDFYFSGFEIGDIRVEGNNTWTIGDEFLDTPTEDSDLPVVEDPTGDDKIVIIEKEEVIVDEEIGNYFTADQVIDNLIWAGDECDYLASEAQFDQSMSSGATAETKTIQFSPEPLEFSPDSITVE